MKINKRAKLDFMRSVFGSLEINSDGLNVAAICPSCKKQKNTTKKKLTIRIDDDRWHCWACDAKGKNLVSLLKRYATEQKLREYLKRFLNENSRVVAEVVSSIPEQPIDILPRDFRLLATLLDVADKSAQLAARYLSLRGIDERDLWYFKFGISSYMMHRNRVIMPSFDAEGIPNYFASRTYDKCITKRKYINARASKSDIIFNEINIDWSESLTLVEGPFDLTKCNDNATCLLGSTLNTRSLLFQRIVKHKTPVILMLDADEHKKTKKIANLLTRYGIDIWTANMASFGSDPGALTKEQFQMCIQGKKRWNSLAGIGDLL